MPIIIDKKNIQSYQLLQLLHLLHQQFDDVKFHAATHLGFPSSDIANFVEINNQKILEINTLGLLGVDSPLPMYMNILSSGENEQSWYDFLNIFNHQFYKLLCTLWIKYHPILSAHNKEAWYPICLNALSAFAFNKINRNDFYLTQFFCRKIKNTNDLLQIMRQILDETNIEIETFIPSWQPILHVTQLDHTSILGNNTTIGDRILDITTTINIHIKLQDIIKAKRLLKGNPLYHKLVSYIQHFLCHGFTCRILITTNIPQSQIPTLNQNCTLNGLNRSSTYITWVNT